MFVFLHGLIGASAHFDVIGARLPAGQTWIAPQIDYAALSLEEHVAQIATRIEAEAMPGAPVVILGNSIGCVLALELADLADHLVLTGPPFDHDTGSIPLRRTDLEPFVRALFTPNMDPAVADDHVAQAVATLDTLTGSRAMLRETRRLRAVSQSFVDHPALGSHDHKITCLLGALDFMAPEDRLRAYLAKVAPRARLQVVHDCGHAVPVEAPDAVLDVLAPWCTASGQAVAV